MKKIVQMKNKQTKISNKIVKKHINSSNVIYSYSRRDFTQPLYLSPPTGLRAPKTPSPIITLADPQLDYNPIIRAQLATCGNSVM